ncbi:MAG: hypothetical protein HRU21_12915, partial [Pseudomonadales bacterium]|nr:hypothetical protein [Pseudomonadales bacterium]
QYSLKIATRLKNDAAQFARLWADYQNSFVANGASSVTDLSDSMFYLETVVKDVKLAQVLGLNNKCSNNSCELNAESPYANAGYDFILANLQAFETIFSGGDGYGFDDAYIERGEAAAAAAMLSDIALARSTAEKLSSQTQSLYAYAETVDRDDCENFAAAPTTGETACHLYGQIKIISDKLKTEFTTIISTGIPNSAAGDGD